MYGIVRSYYVNRSILACMYMSFLFNFCCVYFMSSHVHARAIFLSFPSNRYSRLGSPGGCDAPTGVLTVEMLAAKQLRHD